MTHLLMNAQSPSTKLAAVSASSNAPGKYDKPVVFDCTARLAAANHKRSRSHPPCRNSALSSPTSRATPSLAFKALTKTAGPDNWSQQLCIRPAITVKECGSCGLHTVINDHVGAGGRNAWQGRQAAAGHCGQRNTAQPVAACIGRTARQHRPARPIPEI